MSKRMPAQIRLAMKRPEFTFILPTKIAQSLSMIFNRRMLPPIPVVKYHPIDQQQEKKAS